MAARLLLVAIFVQFAAMFGLTASAQTPQPAQPPRTILLLDSAHAGLPWIAAFADGFIKETRAADQPVVVLSEHLDAARFPGEDQYLNFAQFIRQKYADRPIDLIVSRGVPTAQMLSGDDPILPGVPRLYVDPGPGVTGRQGPAFQDGIITAQADVITALDSMIEIMQPKQIVIIGETQTPLTRRLVEAIRREHPSGHYKGIAVSYLLDLPVSEIAQEVATLPAKTAAFYLPILRDGSQQRQVPYQVVEQIAKRSSAPVFSHWDSLMGSGIVGGYMLSGERIGRNAAINAQAIISGRLPSLSKVNDLSNFAHFYDGRALQRFDIKTSQLPEGSEILYAQQSFIDEHFDVVIAVTALILFLVAGSSLWIVMLRQAVNKQTSDIMFHNETLRFLTQRGWEEYHDTFFNSVAKHICHTLNVDYAFIDIVAPDQSKARTVALYAMGKFPGNIEYDLADTPCDNVYGKNLCCYPQGIQNLFPKDTLLKEMGAESYIGIPLWDSHQQPIGLIAVIDSKPLVNREQAEALLQLMAMRVSQELEHMIVQESLIEAKTNAEIASHAKSEFLANMSHELRTPLNSIIGFSEMMEMEVKGALPDDYHEYAHLISQSGRLLLETVNSILDLAKIESGKFDLNKESTNLENLMREVVALLDIQAKSKGIELIDKTENLPTLPLDHTRIKQVLMNVIGNAIKFTDQGTVIISHKGYKNEHIITVSDTGIGMSEEQIDVALKPFSQVHGTSSARRYQGTGLGLSLSHQILALHGGELAIVSRPGQGTVVTLALPV